MLLLGKHVLLIMEGSTQEQTLQLVFLVLPSEFGERRRCSDIRDLHAVPCSPSASRIRPDLESSEEHLQGSAEGLKTRRR